MARRHDFVWNGWSGRFAWDDMIAAAREEEAEAARRRTILGGYVLAGPDWSGQQGQLPLPFSRPFAA